MLVRSVFLQVFRRLWKSLHELSKLLKVEGSRLLLDLLVLVSLMDLGCRTNNRIIQISWVVSIYRRKVIAISLWVTFGICPFTLLLQSVVKFKLEWPVKRIYLISVVMSPECTHPYRSHIQSVCLKSNRVKDAQSLNQSQKSRKTRSTNSRY